MSFIAFAIWIQLGLLTGMPQIGASPQNAVGDSRTDGKQQEAIQPAETRLQKLVEGHTIVVHVVLEKASYTGMLNSHRAQVKKIYKGQNLDVKSVFAHLAFNDADYPLSSKKPKDQMPELMPGEYVMVLEAEPVADSFAISSFGLRVTPEPSFSYTIVRDGDQHAAWPIDSPQAQTVIRLCAADKTSTQASTATPEELAQAQSIIATIGQACKTYKLSVGSYPTSLEDLQRLPSDMTETQWGGPYLEVGNSNLNDPWGQPFEIQVDDAGELTIRSCGPDGKSRTQDDIDTVQSLPENAAPLTWKDLFGKEPPREYSPDALPLIAALNNSRGEWIFGGKIQRDGKESTFEATMEIQGGFKNMIRVDSFPQWQIAIAWPREKPTEGLVLNVMGLPEPTGINWMLAPQVPSKDAKPNAGTSKMYQGAWDAATNTLTWTSKAIRSPRKKDEAETTSPTQTPEEPKSTFKMVIRSGGEIEVIDFPASETFRISGQTAARIGKPFVEETPTIDKLPNGYKIFFASREEVTLSSRTGLNVAGPRIDKIGCEGNLIFGLIAPYEHVPSRSDTTGYFWLDTSTEKITKGLELKEWQEALNSKGVNEPRLFAPESIGDQY